MFQAHATILQSAPGARPSVLPEQSGRILALIQKSKRALRAVVGPRAYASLAQLVFRQSETSRYRKLLAQYCLGYGIDVGFGGDAITASAIRMDLPSPYTRVGVEPVQLGGDCRVLTWWRDGVLDYVYSSHLLEDFPEVETPAIIREWTRVLKPGGRLILLLPDQQRYLTHCRRIGEINADGVLGNAHHSIAHFSLEYVDAVASRLGTLRRVASHPSLGPYSFAVVYEKMV